MTKEKFEKELRKSLRDAGIKDSDYIDDIISAAEDWFDAGDSGCASWEECLDAIETGTLAGYYDDCHSSAFVAKAVSSCDDEQDIFMELSEGEQEEDLSSWLENTDYAEKTKDFFTSAFSAGEIEPYSSSFYEGLGIFDEAFQNGLEHYGNDSDAVSYAEACWRGGEVVDIDDDFENFLSEGEPWVCTHGDDRSFKKDEEYSSSEILSDYYEVGHNCMSYDEEDGSFSMGDACFTSKGFMEAMENTEFEEEENDNADSDEE